MKINMKQNIQGVTMQTSTSAKSQNVIFDVGIFSFIIWNNWMTPVFSRNPLKPQKRSDGSNIHEYLVEETV